MMEATTTVGPKYKYLVLFALFLAWILGGIDRTVISFAAIPITKEFNLDPVDVGQIFSIFFLGYMLLQIPGGFLADKYGPKKVLLTIVFVWSIFTAATGLVGGLTSMLAIRFLFGAAEAPFSAAAALTIGQIFEAKDRGKAMSLYLSSSGFVMVFAPIIAAHLIDSMGWRNLFFILGACGVGIIVTFYYTFKGSKLQAARELVTGTVQQTGATKTAKAETPLSAVLKIPLVWWLMLAYFATYTLMWGLGNWMPTYLVQTFNVNIKQAGTLQAIPGFGSLAGFVVSGFIIDALSDKQNKIIAVAVSVISTVALYILYLGQMTVTGVIIIQTVVNFAVGFVGIFIPALILKKLPVDFAGRITGIGLFCAYLGSTIAPTVMGAITKASGGNLATSFIYIFAAGVAMTLSMVFMKTSVEKNHN